MAEKAKTSAPTVQFPSTISDQHSVGEVGRILDELSADQKNLCLKLFDLLGVNEDNAKQMGVAEMQALDASKPYACIRKELIEMLETQTSSRTSRARFYTVDHVTAEWTM